MSITIDIDGFLYQAASANGWRLFCDWVEKLEDSDALKEFCVTGLVTNTEQVVTELREALTKSLPKTAVVHTAQGLLEAIGNGGVEETMEVVE